MVAPVNRLPVTPPTTKVSRASVLDDAVFEALAAVRRLLTNDEPKIVLAAAKIILEFEKDRTRKMAKLGYDPLTEQFDEVPPTPQVSDPELVPATQVQAEPEPETRPAPRFDPPPAPLVGEKRGTGIPACADRSTGRNACATRPEPVAPTDKSG